MLLISLTTILSLANNNNASLVYFYCLSASSHPPACNANVNVTMRFGESTISWPVSDADFVFQQRGNTCIGAFIAIDTTGSQIPPWIVGDTFLKNVYSVYRANPPSVGFAALSAAATAQNGRNGFAPSPTIGATSAVATGGVRSSNNKNAAAANAGPRWAVVAAAAAVVVASWVV